MFTFPVGLLGEESGIVVPGVGFCPQDLTTFTRDLTILDVTVTGVGFCPQDLTTFTRS